MRILKSQFWPLLLFLSFAVFGDDALPRDKYALVIIDMQPYFITRGGNDKTPSNTQKVKKLIKEQQEMIEIAKDKKIPIVVVEYNTYGDTNSDLKKTIGDYKEVKTILKDTDSMFEFSQSAKDLDAYLKKNHVGKLIITGANGGACVKRSIQGALDRKLEVISYTKGVADFNYEKFIYPYKGQYKFNTECPTCKFREVDDAQAISLELALSTPETQMNVEVNDSDKGLIKDLPIYEAPTPNGSNSATAQ